MSAPFCKSAYVVETTSKRTADGTTEGAKTGTVVAHVSDELVYYVHGPEANSVADVLPRATRWLRVAAALHAPTIVSCGDAAADQSVTNACPDSGNGA
jgi:hypothetical protein